MNWFNYLHDFALHSYFNEPDLLKTAVIFVGQHETRKKINVNLQVEKKYLILVERDIVLEVKDENNSSSSEVDIIVLNAAQVHCILRQTSIGASKSVHRVFLTEKSNVKYSALFFDNSSIDYSFEFHLVGAEASVYFTGLALFKGTDLNTITTKQIHHAPHTTSHLVFKSALFEQATVHYKGTVIVEEHASHSCASQYNKTILCSEKSRATALPSLEVKTDEVRCQHGSALGQLDQQQIWYLQSRGFNKEQATSLLLQAFFAEKNIFLDDDIKKYVQVKINELVQK